jgi:hypothetical protein
MALAKAITQLPVAMGQRRGQVETMKTMAAAAKMAVGVGVTVAMLLPAAAMAQTVPSNEAIEKAIAEGLKGKGSMQGLEVEEASAKVGSFIHAMNTGLNGYSNSAAPSSGFRVVIYTPLTWIRQQASDAAKEYRPYTLENVREEDRAPVLRMVVYPDTATEVSARGASGTASVQHVVLRDKAKKVVIQPTLKESFNENVGNAMGGKLEYVGVRLEFPLDGLRELRGAKGDQEFVVTVVGLENREKNFDIKKKHFERMP